MTANHANAPLSDRFREIDFAEAAHECCFRFDGDRLAGRIEPLQRRRTFRGLRKLAAAMFRFAGRCIIDASVFRSGVSFNMVLTIMTRARHCGDIIAGALGAKREATTA